MIEIIEADFLEIVAAGALPPVDVVIVDPPYSPHVHANTTSVNTRAGRGVTRRDLGFGALTPELRDAIAAVRPRRWSVVFSDVEGTEAWRLSHVAAGQEYIRALPWVRWSQPQLSGDRPPTGCEMVSLFHTPGRKSWNGHGGLTHYDAASVRERDKYSAEKPLDLMLALVSQFSDPGDLVLDMCAGVGTTAVACDWLGRSCLAIEGIGAVAERASERLARPWDRDVERARRWVAENLQSAKEAHARRPRIPAEQAAWERAGRRLRDLEMVARKVAT